MSDCKDTLGHDFFNQQKLINLLQQYFEIRSKRILKLRESRQPTPYPYKFNVDLSISAFIEKYDNLQPGEHLDEVIQVAGRIHNKRSSGAKLRFYDLHGEGGKIQIMAQAQ